MRHTVLAAVLCASSAMAQDISGTFTANFVDFNEFGLPRVSLTLNLSCSLTCPPSSPTMSFGVPGLADAYFLAAPTEKVGYVSVGFVGSLKASGTATAVNESFPAGSQFTVKAKSVTCWCGNANGQGGYIDLTTQSVSIPPWISLPSERAVVGERPLFFITAAPKGTETLNLQVSGAGIAFTRAYTTADVGNTGAAPGTVLPEVMPTQAGTVTITTSISPGGPVVSKTFEVVAAGTGGGAGGGSGSGGGDGSEPGEGCGGCTAAPGASLLAVAALMGLRRRRPSRS